MRDAATKADDLRGIQAWAGQSCALARARPAEEVVRTIWEGAVRRLSG
jgi:nitronate monooxygenase